MTKKLPHSLITSIRAQRCDYDFEHAQKIAVATQCSLLKWWTLQCSFLETPQRSFMEHRVCRCVIVLAKMATVQRPYRLNAVSTVYQRIE